MKVMSERDVLKILEECKALLTGHFLLTSGRHSDKYVEKFRVLEHPHLTGQLCSEWVRRFADSGIQTVVGPATGGIILAFETARQLGVRAVFTERGEEKRMALRRGFQIKRGERVLVVEDVVTTGGSVKEVLQLLRAIGACVVGVGLLVDRSEQPLDFGVRTEVLLKLPMRTFSAEECPQCQQGVLLQKPGSRYL